MEGEYRAGSLQHAITALLIVISLEIGLLLLVVPWTANWDHNYFLQHLPALRGWILSPFCRGAVSGLGLLNLWWGTGQITHFRRR
jgi:hypothetical protein